MLAALGLFVFDMGSFPFETLARRSGWTHARADRVGARAASQFTGPGNENVSFTGAILPGVTGGLDTIEQLRSMADAGDEYPLVGGDGQVLGSFVIVSMDEGRKDLLPDGSPRSISFSIELERVD